MGWQNDWDREGYLPDDRKLKHKFERWVEMGYCDQIVSLGRELMERDIQQVEQFDDEGETMMTVSDCLSVVFGALLHSSLSIVDKIQYVIDAHLQDDYELVDDAGDPILTMGQPEDWATMIDTLRVQLEELPCNNAQDDFSEHYHRDRLSGWLLRAFQKAGKKMNCEPCMRPRPQAAMSGW